MLWRHVDVFTNHISKRKNIRKKLLSYTKCIEIETVIEGIEGMGGAGAAEPTIENVSPRPDVLHSKGNITILNTPNYIYVSFVLVA